MCLTVVLGPMPPSALGEGGRQNGPRPFLLTLLPKATALKQQ